VAVATERPETLERYHENDQGTDIAVSTDQDSAVDTENAPSPTPSHAHLDGPIETLVFLTVQRLKSQPFIGSGCCAVAAADAIEHELHTWPFVVAVTVNEGANEIAMTVRVPGADLEAIVEVLESMGYPAVVR